MGNLGGGSGCATRSGTLQWMLLNTVPVHTLEEAVEKLNWYTMRWGIEVFHRTLKGGCKIEERQLGSVDRIETCLAIDMVVAWRIQHLTEMSDRDAGGFMHRVFRRRGMEKLVAYTTGNAASPETPPTLREATRMVASLGVFLSRTGDGESGVKTIWLGLQRLDDLSAMWKLIAS